MFSVDISTRNYSLCSVEVASDAFGSHKRKKSRTLENDALHEKKVFVSIHGDIRHRLPDTRSPRTDGKHVIQTNLYKWGF